MKEESYCVAIVIPSTLWCLFMGSQLSVQVEFKVILGPRNNSVQVCFLEQPYLLPSEG